MGRLWGPAEGNVRGHFEDIDFEELHRSILLRRRKGSRGWVVTDDRPIALGMLGKRRARRLIEQRDRVYDAWGWKDPRTALFLEDYVGLLPRLNVFLVSRPKQEVVESLLRRSASAKNPHMLIDRDSAERMVDGYERRLTSFRKRHPARVVAIDLPDFLRNDRAVFDELNHRAGGGLRYQPLSALFDPELLSSD